jgi:hypothetical protein
MTRYDIAALQQLEPGWDEEDAPAIDTGAIARAQPFVALLPDSTVGPMRSGGVSLLWWTEEHIQWLIFEPHTDEVVFVFSPLFGKSTRHVLSVEAALIEISSLKQSGLGGYLRCIPQGGTGMTYTTTTTTGTIVNGTCPTCGGYIGIVAWWGLTPPKMCQCAYSAPEVGAVGWICPKCGAGCAPFTQRCPCAGFVPYRVTCRGVS